MSATRFEFIGEAIKLQPDHTVSILSDPNLNVTHGVQTIFASSCIEPKSVTTAFAFVIISITS
jgi:hypothetical protein